MTSVQTTSPAPKPDSRTNLLNAALLVIRTKGYTGTTVDDICQAAGVTKGSFFYHFKTKDELALAATDHFASMANSLFASAAYRQAADPLDRVLGYIDFRSAILQGTLAEFTCLLGTMVQETYETHPALREACNKHISDHAAMVAKDIAQAKQLYAPAATWTVESLAFHTQAVLQGAFILAKAQNGSHVAAECIAHLRRYVVSLFPLATTPRSIDP